jgi:hypothetical protein
MKQLSCEQAKQIDMIDYLSSLNHHPQRVHHQDFWYLSPLREERTASFKVNRTLNVWFDFGIGKGGDVIDFSTMYHNCTISEALSKLSIFQNKPILFFQPPTVFGYRWCRLSALLVKKRRLQTTVLTFSAVTGWP